MRKTYKWDPERMEMVEYEAQPRFDGHYVIGDEMDATVHHGLPPGQERVFTSKSRFREVTKSLGLTEYGNDKPKDEAPRPCKIDWKDTWERSEAEVKQGMWRKR